MTACKHNGEITFLQFAPLLCKELIVDAAHFCNDCGCRVEPKLANSQPKENN